MKPEDRRWTHILLGLLLLAAEEMKKFAVPIIILGGGLAAFGLSGWRRYGWEIDARIEIALGVVLLLLGIFLRK